MRTKHLWRLASLVTLLAMFISPIGPAHAAPIDTPQATPKTGMQVIDASFVGASKPLGSLTSIPAAPKDSREMPIKDLRERLTLPKTENGASGGSDAAVQTDIIGNSMPATTANFEGVSNVNGVLPPDTQGDIGYDPATGTKYYIQWVNLSFQIWDVTNPTAVTSLYGPAAGNTLWSGTGTICDTNNDGDPITQFDHLANRWMMSQFALSFPNDFHQCIAISATADPLGVWYLYDFQTSTTLMNDYPKFGVWPDGYYMSVNQFNGVFPNPWEGAGVAVFERDAMLAGLTARMIYIDVGASTLNFGGMLPSDLDGPTPVAGTPNYFMEWDDSTWLGDPADTLRVWEFHTDWVTPANTTFGLNAAFDPNLTIATADVDPTISCGGSGRDCIPQPGTTEKLDAINDRLMYRLQYRDFGSYQTIVGNHTVDAATDQAGVHWFELRDTGSGLAMYQEGVYAPTTENRWMGSVAMDDAGDIALGYSVSSSSTYPSIRYTGRLPGDPLNTLPQGEATLITGGGSQTHSASRWGDYSMMAVDPTDGCTFWYTQEYMAYTGSAPWKTRVGSFKFPSCTSLPTGTLTGLVTDASSSPLMDAAIELTGGYSTITDATGHYTIDVPAGSYDVTASKYGYVSQTVTGLSVTNGGTTTQNFALTVAATHTISGVVTNATTGWPLYAAIDITDYPYSPIFTDPVTGAFSVALVDAPYTFTVNAMSDGYDPNNTLVTVAADATQNFTLSADLISCQAPGYVQSSDFYEGFDGATMPGTWTVVDNAGFGVTWDLSSNWGDGNYTGGSGTAADVNSDAVGTVDYDTELISPVITTASLTSGTLLTYLANYQQYSFEALDLDIKVDGGAWTNLISWSENHGALYSTPGVGVGLDLAPTITGSTNFQLRWHYYDLVSNYDWYAQIDEVSIGSCDPLASGGLVIGSVLDANNGMLVMDAQVEDGISNLATLIDSSADSAQPAQLYVIGQPSGAQALSASAPFSPYYGVDDETVTVMAGGTVGFDFILPAGDLSADPGSRSFIIYDNEARTRSAPIEFGNPGGLPTEFKIFPVDGPVPSLTPTGPFADNTRHVGPKNLNDMDASKTRFTGQPTEVTPLAAGDVTTAWSTGLVYPWGIGFNTDANDMWIGNLGAAGGDDLNYRFLADGTNTGDTIDTTPWVGSFGGDMAYNSLTGMLWQVNVGGDNCIYEMDPVTMLDTGNAICPDFGTSERGLAFDPATNTYYTGSWTDGIINHFAPDGTILDSVNANLDISGLAFNPVSGHLFAMTNSASDTSFGLYDVYVLDVNDSYSIVGAFNLMNAGVHAFADYKQAGLEMDCNGNLWAVNQGNKLVYKANSGETGACGWQATWLSATPSTSTLASGIATNITVNVDATGMADGPYEGYLRVVSDTPYGDMIIPVDLTLMAAPVTFVDVPNTYWAWTWIEHLYAAGVTSGCTTSPLAYCPDSPVTRAQMAVFLLKAEHGSSYAPPAVGSSTGFTDVPTTYWAAAWIKQLAAEGITSGCGANLYCPDNNVTRAEMAVFIDKMFALP
ncbi:MAG: carboxypeptidase regulatory-like domain-containing protein [Chloroflexi bacterium]|nr:carboxypeptidase regulatory-like domain-containing protein [Chloroflexota bacterium]